MSDASLEEEEEKVNLIFEAPSEESSIEIPMEKWSSLLITMPEENRKRALFNEGRYYPGSGNVCAKYIRMSNSSILKHPYYNYPAVLDPGILDALLSPEEEVDYPDDGQELYMAICKQTEQCPIRSFVKDLFNEVINLRHYGISSNGVRPIALALSHNKIVKVLDLTDNFLNIDACYHLGKMLSTNTAIVELNLSGCRIGPEGAKRIFDGLLSNRTLKVLNLNKNQLYDAGIAAFAKSVFHGLDINEIYLSYNSIGGKGARCLAETLETHNKFTHIDLSWNNLYSPQGTCSLLNILGESVALQNVNLSWNAMADPRLGTALKNVCNAKNLRYFDLSNNKLHSQAIYNLLPGLSKAKKLETLDLSFNPITPEDALKVLLKLKTAAVKVQQVKMDNVCVTGEFLLTLNSIKQLKSKKNLVVTYGGVIASFKPVGQDPRELLLNRADFLAKKSKKTKVDIALVAMQLLKDNFEIMSTDDFADVIKKSGARLDEDLLEEIVNVFAGPRTAKTKTINMKLLVDYIKRKWPDRKLPPTPPPEPEPEPIPEPVKQKGKGKGKGKNK